MAIEPMMPALSPTMEKGTLAKWLVAEGDLVKTGDLIAEIETDKATMEYEAASDGRIAKPGVSSARPRRRTDPDSRYFGANTPARAARRPDQGQPARRAHRRCKGHRSRALAGSGPNGRIVRADLGIGGGYGFDRTKVGENNEERLDAENWVGAVYGSLAPADGMFVDGVFGIGGLDFDTRRAAG